MRSKEGCTKTHKVCTRAFSSASSRPPYWLRICWNRASASTWASGESFDISGGACGAAAAEMLCSSNEPAGTRKAETNAARWANSRLDSNSFLSFIRNSPEVMCIKQEMLGEATQSGETRQLDKGHQSLANGRAIVPLRSACVRGVRALDCIGAQSAIPFAVF